MELKDKSKYYNNISNENINEITPNEHLNLVDIKEKNENVDENNI